jgi:hypothetical protein
MIQLKELKELLKEAVALDDTDLNGIMESLSLIPEVEQDDMCYTPTRPDVLDSEKYLNVIGPDSNVYPMFLDRLVRTDGYGSYFNVSPINILKMFVGGFSENEVLGPRGDGRMPQSILRLPLTLDYYTFFVGREDSLRLYLVFLVSYLFEFDSGITIFERKKPRNRYTGFSLNCPYSEIMDLSTLYKYQQKIKDILQGINFKEKDKDDLVEETKNIMKDTVEMVPIEALVKNEMVRVEFCAECSKTADMTPTVRPIVEDPSRSGKDVKWSFSSKKFEVDVTHIRKEVASRFYNIVITSLNNKQEGGHNHIGAKVYQNLTEKLGDGRRLFSDIGSLIAYVFRMNGMNWKRSVSLGTGAGCYIADVPYVFLTYFPFFRRNVKRLFVDWAELKRWYESQRASCRIREKQSGTFGLIFEIYKKDFLYVQQANVAQGDGNERHRDEIK